MGLSVAGHIIAYSIETRKNSTSPVLWWFIKQWVMWHYRACANSPLFYISCLKYYFPNSHCVLYSIIHYSPIFWEFGVLGSYSSAIELPLTRCMLLAYLQNSFTSFSVMVSGGWFNWCNSCCTHLNTTSESFAAWLWYLEWSDNTCHISCYVRHRCKCEPLLFTVLLLKTKVSIHTAFFYPLFYMDMKLDLLS